MEAKGRGGGGGALAGEEKARPGKGRPELTLTGRRKAGKGRERKPFFSGNKKAED